MRKKLALAVLVSGRGSNLEAILTACQSGAIQAEVRIVLSNRPRCRGLEIARQAGIATLALSRRRAGGRPPRCGHSPMRPRRRRPAGWCWPDSTAWSAERCWSVLKAASSTSIPRCCRHLPDQWRPDPKPPPSPPGSSTQAAPCTWSPPSPMPVRSWTRAVVPVHDDDDPQSLAARILDAEHRLLPAVINPAGRLPVAGAGAADQIRRATDQ